MKKHRNRNGATPEGSDDRGLTGRYIVLLAEGAAEQGARSLNKLAGVSAQVLKGDPAEETVDASTQDVIFSNIGAAVVEMDPDQIQALSTSEERADTPVLAMAPERYVYMFGGAYTDPGNLGDGLSLPLWSETPLSLDGTGLAPQRGELSLEEALAGRAPLEGRAAQEFNAAYLRGYRDSVVQLVDKLLGDEMLQAKERVSPLARDWNESESCWGLQVTGVVGSRMTGKGIKIAVLDTGGGPHRDFAGRNILAMSFVPGQEAKDVQGHGTHCMGVACGYRPLSGAPRYGVAREAGILVGKVLGDDGFGTDGGILAGINWALAQGAHVISMSLGSDTQPGEAFSQVYEGVAKRALARGTLIVAAAGNDSNRPTSIRPVGHPANCPSIVAVGALEPTLEVARFSNGGINPNGGEVNIVAPGVDILSSVPLPPFFRRLSGTSMATPFVAGIAAMFAQATGKRGKALWQEMARAARRLPLPSRDVGVGLVRAP